MYTHILFSPSYYIQKLTNWVSIACIFYCAIFAGKLVNLFLTVWVLWADNSICIYIYNHRQMYKAHMIQKLAGKILCDKSVSIVLGFQFFYDWQVVRWMIVMFSLACTLLLTCNEQFYCFFYLLCIWCSTCHNYTTGMPVLDIWWFLLLTQDTGECSVSEWWFKSEDHIHWWNWWQVQTQ